MQLSSSSSRCHINSNSARVTVPQGIIAVSTVFSENYVVTLHIHMIHKKLIHAWLFFYVKPKLLSDQNIYWCNFYLTLTACFREILGKRKVEDQTYKTQQKMAVCSTVKVHVYRMFQRWFWVIQGHAHYHHQLMTALHSAKPVYGRTPSPCLTQKGPLYHRWLTWVSVTMRWMLL